MVEVSTAMRHVHLIAKSVQKGILPMLQGPVNVRYVILVTTVTLQDHLSAKNVFQGTIKMKQGQQHAGHVSKVFIVTLVVLLTVFHVKWVIMPTKLVNLLVQNVKRVTIAT